MGIFYYHPNNPAAQKIRDADHELAGAKGFFFNNRAELDFKLARLIKDAGYDLWPTFYTTLGPLGGPGDLVSRIELDPANPMDVYAAKLCKQGGAWSFVKVHNGHDRFVIGYSTANAAQPFNMTSAEMAQKGIIQSTYVPRPV